MSIVPRSGRIGLALLALVFLPSVMAADLDGEVDLLAQLVWGTDGPKPEGKDLKDIDQAMRDKLRGVFRWKNYYEVGRKEFKVAPGNVSRVRMSPKCEIEVRNLERSTIEVKLFGEGKMVVKKRQILKPVELLVLAGDDKDDTAWFVVLRRKAP